MNHEKILKRPDGSQVMIRVSFYSDYNKSSFTWYAMYKSAGKKKWLSPHSTGDYTWRALNNEERLKYQNEKYLQYVTKDEVHEAMRELINSIKFPEL